ncbi:hypothetical protein PISMIDRAFT_500311 [Pisolithus microcarpus 441]|uniref:Uncharacterized protein n=1 Tax=Pisolithus microcarpus 441 TaxID=765257 RepID=A0A0C9YU51_9AGAM|nr:hypothetical protein PISMIDRAFT_500311 [Pisolithus microcarpus 441]
MFAVTIDFEGRRSLTFSRLATKPNTRARLLHASSSEFVANQMVFARCRLLSSMVWSSSSSTGSWLEASQVYFRRFRSSSPRKTTSHDKFRSLKLSQYDTTRQRSRPDFSRPRRATFVGKKPHQLGETPMMPSWPSRPRSINGPSFRMFSVACFHSEYQGGTLLSYSDPSSTMSATECFQTSTVSQN